MSDVRRGTGVIQQMRFGDRIGISRPVVSAQQKQRGSWWTTASRVRFTHRALSLSRQRQRAIDTHVRRFGLTRLPPAESEADDCGGSLVWVEGHG